MEVTCTRRSQWEWNIRREDIDYLIYQPRSFLRLIESVAIIYDKGGRKEKLKRLILDRIIVGALSFTTLVERSLFEIARQRYWQYLVPPSSGCLCSPHSFFTITIECVSYRDRMESTRSVRYSVMYIASRKNFNPSDPLESSTRFASMLPANVINVTILLRPVHARLPYVGRRAIYTNNYAPTYKPFLRQL